MIPQFEPLILPEYIETVSNTMKSGWVGSGKLVTQFEDMVVEYTGTKYAIATSSGTTALLTVIYSLDKKSSNYILPNYSFIAAKNVVDMLKLPNILVDINYDTMCLEYTELFDLSCNNGVVIFINHNGYVGKELIKIKQFCEQQDVVLIEDAACALGQRYNGKHAGTFGLAGCFSFSVPKIVTTGQGGMIITEDKILAERCRAFIDQGSTTWRQDQLHLNVGLNFKMSNIAAAYGIAQMKILDWLLDKRYKNQQYMIDSNLKLHTYTTDNKTGTWMNILQTNPAKFMLEYLKHNHIESKMYYKPTTTAIGVPNTLFPVSERVYGESLYIPSSLTLTEDQLTYICRKIHEA